MAPSDFLRYLSPWQWRSWHGSLVLIQPSIICLVIERLIGSFFRPRLMGARIGMPAWMQRFGANLFADSNARDGAEAVRLAERACALTDRRIPGLLATLAAAYAETGDFSRGVATGEEALKRAQAIRDTDSVKLSENVLTALRADLPYRNKPEQ